MSKRKNPHAVALGRVGGKKDGKVLSEKKLAHLRRIAGLGARARWEPNKAT